MCMAKLETYPSVLITLVQKHHDIYIRRIVCNTSFENGHMHWLGGDASVNGGGKSGYLQRFLQLYNLENRKVDSFVRHCWLLVWHLQVWAQWVWVTWPATCVTLCRCKQPKWQAFFRAFAAMAVPKSSMTLLILDLLHQNLRYHFSPKTTAGGETL